VTTGTAWRSVVGAAHNVIYAARLSAVQSYAFQFLRNKRRFPGLGVHPSAKIVSHGDLRYGSGVGIDEGATIIIPIGGALELGANDRIGRYVELGPSTLIRLGDQVSIQDRSILVGDVTIGRYSFLSLNVLMTSGTHIYDRWPELLIRDQDARAAADASSVSKSNRPIVVEEDCWIGMNAVVMPGVVIGRGAVVGSNAVVSRDVPPYAVVAGVPATIIKRRLNFEPPKQIVWSEVGHIPYFYRGFALSAQERVGNEALGGHLALRDFAIWLAPGTGSQVQLSVRSSGDESTLLADDGSRFAIGADWSAVSFAASLENSPACIGVTGAPVIVHSATAA
jgi:acetyltransferase-like isoleucine patch superfamily enzyme